MNLAELQECMSSFLYTRHPTDEQASAVMRLVDDTLTVDPEDGFRVYRQNLLLGVALELRSTFSRTRELLGKKPFDECARSYLYSSDSTSKVAEASGRGLGEVGIDFPASVRALHGRLAAADMADLEWAQEEAFFAATDEPISEERIHALLELPAEEIHLRLRTSFTLLTPRYPVHRDSFDEPELGLHLAVWRDEGRYRTNEIEPQLWPMMRAIDAGESLAAITELPHIKAHPERLQECLTLLLIRGWLRQPKSEER